MTTLQTSDNQTPGQTTAIADSTIEFRVSRPGSPRRRLKLVGSRYTIGSGPECSVRLDDPSVRPLHAVLERENGRVLLRAYGAPILLNGRAVAEGELVVDNHFQIGPYDFELSVGPHLMGGKAATKSAQRSPSFPPQPQPESNAKPNVRDQRESFLPHQDRQSKLAAKAPQDARVVPRRRLSFASAMQFVSAEQDDAGQDDVDRAEVERDTAQCREQVEPKQQAVPESQAVPQQQTAAEQPVGSEQALMNELGAERLSVEKTFTRPLSAEVFDQHRAILANERRWQDRSKKQLEKFRQREEKSAAQVEALRTAQEVAERRARNAEDAVETLKQQVTELAGRIAAVTSTVMPGLEQRIDQQYQESVVATRQYQSLVDGLRGRLDFLQSALTEVQAETEEIRQQTVATREDQQEFAANSDTLEQTLQRMAEEYQAGRAEADEKAETLRQNLYQTSLKLADLTGQLEETRQNGHGLGAMVQQLRSSLQNAQTEAQRFATVEQIEETVRLLKANDQRISQLTEEYDSQSSQLQHECDALRQRLEQSEQVAADALTAATEALNEAVDQRSKIELLAEVSACSTQSTSNNLVREDTTVNADSSDADSSDADSSDARVGNHVDAGGMDVDSLPATYDQNSPKDHLDAVEVSWYDADADSDLKDDPSLSQSQFHLPLEIAAPGSENRIQESLNDSSVGMLQPQQVDDQQVADHDDQADFAATYQYDPGFGLSNSATTDETNEEPAEAAESYTDDAEPLGLYGATAFLDEPLALSADEENPDTRDPPKVEEEPNESSAVGKSGPRSAAEVLASLGISIDDPEAVESSSNDQRSAPLASNPQATPEPVVAAPEPVAASAEGPVEAEEDEDSIEAYMNRLLRRVQGQSEADAPESRPQPQPQVVAPVAKPPESTEPGNASQLQTPASPTAPTSTPAQPDSPYVPRSQAPERSGNLAAMRELANSSARTAIATSARKKMSNDVLFKYGLFGMGLLAGGAVLVGTQFEVGPWMLIAVCCFGLSGFFLLEGFNLSKQLSETRPGNGDNQPAETVG